MRKSPLEPSAGCEARPSPLLLWLVLMPPMLTSRLTANRALQADARLPARDRHGAAPGGSRRPSDPQHVPQRLRLPVAPAGPVVARAAARQMVGGAALVQHLRHLTVHGVQPLEGADLHVPTRGRPGTLLEQIGRAHV